MNGDGRDRVAAAAWLYELDESLQSMHGAELGRGVDFRARRRHLERVALVLTERLHGCGDLFDLDDELGGPGDSASGMTKAGDHFDTP